MEPIIKIIKKFKSRITLIVILAEKEKVKIISVLTALLTWVKIIIKIKEII
jgi:hypothetical protein